MASFSSLKWQAREMRTLEVHLLEAQTPLLVLFGELCVNDDRVRQFFASIRFVIASTTVEVDD